MNKATIIEDSITYITELKKSVDVLQGQLGELERAIPTDKNEIKCDSEKRMVEETTNIEVPTYPTLIL